MPPKVAVIGLDCAEPSLLFDRWLNASLPGDSLGLPW